VACVSFAKCVLYPKGLFGNSVGQLQDERRPSRPRSAMVSFDFFGTLFAHLQTHSTLSAQLDGLGWLMQNSMRRCHGL
jgi:hypothetical protein